MPRADLEHSTIFERNSHDTMSRDGSVLDLQQRDDHDRILVLAVTRSPTRSDAIGCSPSGVATGLSGAAHIGHMPPPHCQTPSVQVMVKVQSGPHDAPGALHEVPACGITVGQPVAGPAQYHWGRSMGWQTGYSVPKLQALHPQRVPSPYQQESMASEQALIWLGAGIGQAADRGGAVQWSVDTCHAPALHTARVRHCGRGSSP